MVTEALTPRMRRLADKLDNETVAADLRQKADDLDAAIDTLYSGGVKATTRRLLGCWARARRAWCNVTGEPLI